MGQQKSYSKEDKRIDKSEQMFYIIEKEHLFRMR